MSLATHSFENRLAAKLAAWKMPLDIFSMVVGLNGISGASKARLHNALGGFALSNEVAERLQVVVDELTALVEAVQPLRLEWKNPALISEWLQLRREGKLKLQLR